MKDKNEVIPRYYPGQMGPPPGALSEDDPAREKIAEQVREPLAIPGTFGPETDRSPFKPPVSKAKTPSGQTLKNPL
jgi:hypothetical protein